jgi:transcriptional regulator with XRE-family HTH domain
MNPAPKTLRDLVREHIDRTGDSYQTIAKKTGLSKPLIGILATSTAPRAYRAETVEKIATGLRLPLDLVTRAAAASAGMTIDEPDTPSGREDARVIAGLLDDLTDDELATLRAMVRAVAESRDR